MRYPLTFPLTVESVSPGSNVIKNTGVHIWDRLQTLLCGFCWNKNTATAPKANSVYGQGSHAKYNLNKFLGTWQPFERGKEAYDYIVSEGGRYRFMNFMRLSLPVKVGLDENTITLRSLSTMFLTRWCAFQLLPYSNLQRSFGKESFNPTGLDILTPLPIVLEVQRKPKQIDNCLNSDEHRFDSGPATSRSSASPRRICWKDPRSKGNFKETLASGRL